MIITIKLFDLNIQKPSIIEMYNKTVADPTSNLDEDNQLSACS